MFLKTPPIPPSPGFDLADPSILSLMFGCLGGIHETYLTILSIMVLGKDEMSLCIKNSIDLAKQKYGFSGKYASGL